MRKLPRNLVPASAACLVIGIFAGTRLAAQAPAPAAHRLPRLVEQDGRYALLVDGAPYLMLGAQIHNSSAWPEMLPEVWPTAQRMGLNTLEAPIYWEQFEPQPGKYDPSVLRVLLQQARAHHVHLVLLWFGSWKNGSGHYIPEFLKSDEARVPHVIGADGRKVDSLSPFSQFLLEKDRAAFVALMRELKAADPQHTVLMVQVENETGTYGSMRDYSPAANQMFAEPVPQELVAAMHTGAGNWRQVFGKDADEFFHAWSTARFVNQVAAAGKAVYPLPLYVNVALRDPIHPEPPGVYSSGGPTDNVIPVWKAGAPAIDIIAPDLYKPGYDFYTRVLELYRRPDNALFVPETSNGPLYPRYFFEALGHGAIGFSPFGMDTTGYSNAPAGALTMDEKTLAPFALNYQIFGPMEREIAKLNFEGKLKAVAEDPAEHTQALAFGEWTAVVSYGLGQFGRDQTPPGNDPPRGGAMVAQLGPNEFLVTGVHARVDFQLTDTASGRKPQFLKVEEGAYRDGAWHAARIWNGDQTDYGLNFTALPQVLRVTLATY